MRIIYFFIVLTLAQSIVGCAVPQKKHPSKGPETANSIYSAGKNALSDGDYESAINYYKSLEALYPADPYTLRAQLDLAYAYYKRGEAASAIAITERFIHAYPANPHADYAYYLRGLASFEQALGIKTSEPSPERQFNPLLGRLSLNYFSELIKRFPKGKYSADTRQRIGYLRDRLAQHEIAEARRYAKEGKYASAAVHAQSILENYPQTPVLSEAVTVANMSYNMLSLSNPLSAPAKVHKEHNGPSEKSPRGENAMPSSAHAVRPGKGRIHRKAWLMSMEPDHYTIQLIGTGNEQALIDLVTNYRLTSKSTYFQSSRLNNPWYTLIYGEYRTITEAKRALNRIPERLLTGRPWIRKIGDIQAAIKAQANVEPPRKSHEQAP